jgi:glycosyltransferase involved in cell wall biosynthesis
MRILWVSPHCWPDYVLRDPGLGIKSQGGQTVVMYHCPRALTAVNPKMHVDVYARMETREPEVKELGERVRLIRRLCGDPDVYVPKEDFWSGPIQQFVEEVDAYVKSNNLQYDLIHGHYADGWYVAHHLSERWGVPYCLTTHSLGIRKRANCLAMQEGTEAELDEKYSFSVRIDHETAALEHANRICPLTAEEGEYILEHYGKTSREQIHSVSNGILLEDFNPRDERKANELRQELGIGERDLVVFQAGRVDRRKGQQELLAAAPRVAREVRSAPGGIRSFCWWAGQGPNLPRRWRTKYARRESRTTSSSTLRWSTGTCRPTTGSQTSTR